MGLLGSDFVLVVAPSFFGATFAIAGAVGVLRLASALAGERRINDEEELPLAGFLLQQVHPQRFVEVVALPAWACEEACELSAMEGFGRDASGGLRATHSSAVHDEGQGHAEDEGLGQFVERSFCDEGLECGCRFRDDDHCESFLWPERISMI